MKNQLSFMVAVFCGGCAPAGSSDYQFDIGKGYYAYRTSAHQVGVFSRESTIGIPPKVVEIGWDSRFIIAKQQELSGASYKEPIAGVFKYWIIGIEDTKAHGPLAEADYLALRDMLGVPKTLELQSIDVARENAAKPTGRADSF